MLFVFVLVNLALGCKVHHAITGNVRYSSGLMAIATLVFKTVVSTKL